MTADTQVLCSFALTFGIPIVVAGWELWHLKPTARRLPPGDDGPLEPTPLPDPGVSPHSQKPLPDCLIPRRSTERVRELA